MAGPDKKLPTARTAKPADGLVPVGVDGRAFLLYALRVAVRPQVPEPSVARTLAARALELVTAFDDELAEQKREAEIRAEKGERELELD